MKWWNDRKYKWKQRESGEVWVCTEYGRQCLPLISVLTKSSVLEGSGCWFRWVPLTPRTDCAATEEFPLLVSCRTPHLLRRGEAGWAEHEEGKLGESNTKKGSWVSSAVAPHPPRGRCEAPERRPAGAARCRQVSSGSRPGAASRSALLNSPV